MLKQDEKVYGTTITLKKGFFLLLFIYFLFFILNYEFFKNKRCYVHNIFTTNHRWLVVIGSNLNLTLKLLNNQ